MSGRLKGGKEVGVKAAGVVTYSVRWHVNESKRRRSFRQKGHAKQWRDTLLLAKLQRWEADDRGWPIDPAKAQAAVMAPEPALPGYTVETYVEQVWWPLVSKNLERKNRLGHHRNAVLAVQLLRIKDGDRRIGHQGLELGDSIPLSLLVAEDSIAAIEARKKINGRTAAQNQRLVAEPALPAATPTSPSCSSRRSPAERRSKRSRSPWE